MQNKLGQYVESKAAGRAGLRCDRFVSYRIIVPTCSALRILQRVRREKEDSV